MKILTSAMITAAALSLCWGCSSGQSTGSVTGKVLQGGEPSGGWEICYISQSDGSAAIGYAKADGSYQLFRGRGNSQLPVGNYKVAVIPTPHMEGIAEPKVTFPKSYSIVEQTTLIKSIERGTNTIDIDLDSLTE